MQDILRGLLSKDPDLRLSLVDAMRHAWTTGSGTLKLLHPSGVPLREFKMSKQDRDNAMTPNITNVFSTMAPTVMHFRKGEIILKEGQISKGLFLVKVCWCQQHMHMIDQVSKRQGVCVCVTNNEQAFH